MTSKIKTVSEAFPTLRSAVLGMIKGLEDRSKDPNFQVEMGSFGHERDGMCFGCAATATVLSVLDVPADVTDRLNFIRTSGLSREEVLDWDRFEDRIDDFRMGDVKPLYRLYGIEYEGPHLGWCLCNDNYLQQLPTIREWLDIYHPEEA